MKESDDLTVTPTLVRLFRIALEGLGFRSELLPNRASRDSETELLL